MASIRKQTGVRPRPENPKQAACSMDPIDDLLDPELFKALAEPTRVKLLSCLVKCGRECSVGEIAECCSVDLSVVARHLVVLARVGVLTARKEGRHVWYGVSSTALADRLERLAETIRASSGIASEPACCKNMESSRVRVRPQPQRTKGERR